MSQGSSFKRARTESVDGEQESSLAYEGLLSRVKKAKESEPPAALKQVLSELELKRLLGFFDEPKSATRVSTKKREAQQDIASLERGESLRLDKAETKLPRTMTVLCDQEGELTLIGETKSKIAGGKKQALPVVGGQFKSGKPAWRLDEYLEYFNLVTQLEDEDDEQNIKDEVAISQALAGEYVNELLLGPVVEKAGAKYISAYSPKSNGNLQELIDSKTLTEPQIKSITLQLLLGLRHTHSKSEIHQDLKPANILVYGDAHSGYRIKINDFGNTSHQGDDAHSLSTWEYSSPEIINFYRRPGTFLYKYCQEYKNNKSYGNVILSEPVMRSWARPDKANDVWAMGIIIFELRHGKMPKNPDDTQAIMQDPLLSGMLHISRKHRLNSDQAVEVYEKELSKYKRKIKKK